MDSTMETDEDIMEKDLNEPERLLKTECEEMWAKLSEVYTKIQCRKESSPPKGIKSDTDDIHVLRTILQAKEKKLQAELAAIKSEEVDVPRKEHQPNEDFVKQKLAERASQLEETLLVIKEQLQEIKYQLEREEEIFEQHQEIQKSIQQKITELEVKKENQHSTNSKVRELDRTREGVEKHLSELMKKLGVFIKDHFPLPSVDDIEGKHQPKHLRDVVKPKQTYISLQQLLEELIKKLIYDSPHDPYINIQPSHWPPYIELLLRCGIAQRHSQDCNLIRLEAFQA